MLWTLAIILLVAWLLGFTVGGLGNLVHILLVVALIVVVFNLVSGRRTM